MPSAGVIEEGLEVVADDGVQKRRLRHAPLVGPWERSGCGTGLTLEVDARLG
jgi:hypothetical protein